MNKLQTVVNAVLKQQKQLVAPSTYDVRKRYLDHLVSHAEGIGLCEPCQELYDSYVARAATPDLRFQLCMLCAWWTKKQERRHSHQKGNFIMNLSCLLQANQKNSFQPVPFQSRTVVVIPAI